MTFYWSVDKLPELDGVDKREVMPIWREATKKASRDPMYWLVFAIAGLGAGVGSIFFDVTGAAIGGGIGGVIAVPFMFNVVRPYVAAIVKEHQSRTTIGENN